MILTATPESNEIKIGPGKMSVDLTSREISRKYDRFALWYDCVQGIPDLLGLSRLRRKLLKRASGKILEIAVGTGKNLRFYPSDCRKDRQDYDRSAGRE